MIARLLTAAFALAVALPALTAGAADAPGRPIRAIIPSAGGGAPDFLMRVLLAEVTAQTGRQFVIDNRPGGSGLIGMEMIAHATPDGLTIGYGNAPTLAINPSLFSKLPYNVAKDYTPVMRLNSSQNLLAVRNSLAVQSVRELVEYARKYPDKLSYASPGNGTTIHLSAELFKQMTGTRMLHVPYKSITQALTELIAGQVDLIFDNLTSIAPQAKAGKVRALAVTGPARTPLFPDLPTVAEAGVPGYEVTTWGGVIAPAGLPPAVLARLSADLTRACAGATVKDKLATVGNQCVGGTPAEFSAFIRSETAKWADVVRKSGAKLD